MEFCMPRLWLCLAEVGDEAGEGCAKYCMPQK